MKAIYEFEKDIIKTYGDEMEPHQEGYSIDDLNKEDRAFVGGVLWALKTIEISRLNHCEGDGDVKTILEQMKEEVVTGFCSELKCDLIADVRDLTVSCLDEYEEENE